MPSGRGDRSRDRLHAFTRAFIVLVAAGTASAAMADGDELKPVAAGPLLGKPYPGVGASSEILFVNTRRSAVRLLWIALDGTTKLYAVIPPGDEMVQPTFVSHRWLVTRADGDAPIEAFISTRSDIHGDGQAQIAIIR